METPNFLIMMQQNTLLLQRMNQIVNGEQLKFYFPLYEEQNVTLHFGDYNDPKNYKFLGEIERRQFCKFVEQSILYIPKLFKVLNQEPFPHKEIADITRRITSQICYFDEKILYDVRKDGSGWNIFSCPKNETSFDNHTYVGYVSNKNWLYYILNLTKTYSIILTIMSIDPKLWNKLLKV